MRNAVENPLGTGRAKNLQSGPRHLSPSGVGGWHKSRHSHPPTGAEYAGGDFFENYLLARGGRGRHSILIPASSEITWQRSCTCFRTPLSYPCCARSPCCTKHENGRTTTAFLHMEAIERGNLQPCCSGKLCIIVAPSFVCSWGSVRVPRESGLHTLSKTVPTLCKRISLD